MTEPTGGDEPAQKGEQLSPVRSVAYRGAELDAERGPGLGCFRFQVIVLAVLIVLTPIGVNAGWPDWLTAGLLFATIALLLVTGQTIIFLLRLVAADRRGRRRPLGSATRTVGELEDADADAAAAESATAGPADAWDASPADAPDASPADAPDESPADAPDASPADARDASPADTPDGSPADAPDASMPAAAEGRDDDPTVRQ